MKSLRHLTVLFSLALLITTLALVVARHQPAATSWTIFAALTDNIDYELYRKLPDGRAMKRLTYHDGSPYATEWILDDSNNETTWSPDHRWLIIKSFGNGRLYRMSATGGIVEPITLHPADFQTWMPDGEHLMIAMNGDLYVMEIDGSNLNVLVGTSEDDYFDKWSPDYRWFTFISSPDLNSVSHPNYSLYRANHDGTALIQFSTGSVERPYVMGWTLDHEWLVIWDYHAQDNPVDNQYMYRIRPDGTDIDYLDLNSDGIDTIIGESGSNHQLIMHYFIGPSRADEDDQPTLLSEIWHFNTMTNNKQLLIAPRPYTSLRVLGRTSNREWVVLNITKLLPQELNLPDLYRLRYDGKVLEQLSVASCWEFYGWSVDHEWIYCGFSGTSKVHPLTGETHRISEGYIRGPQFYDAQSLYPIDLNWQPTRLLIFSVFGILFTLLRPKQRRQPPPTTSTSIL